MSFAAQDATFFMTSIIVQRVVTIWLSRDII